MQEESRARDVPNSIAVVNFGAKVPPCASTANRPDDFGNAALEAIHQQFLKLHLWPPPTVRQPPGGGGAPSRTVRSPKEEARRALSSSPLDSMSIIDKRLLLESLKRKRIAMRAALQERRWSSTATTTTTLRHDLAAQRKRQQELARRPYLRFLVVSSVDVDPPRCDGGTRTFRRWGGGGSRSIRGRRHRHRRRALDFVAESILLNDAVTHQGVDMPGAAVSASSSSTSNSQQPATSLTVPGHAVAAASNVEADVATQRSAARLLRMASSSYLLLAGISVSLEDEGQVLALQFDPRSSFAGAANGSDKHDVEEEGSFGADEDDAMADDAAPPAICCAFLQFVTEVASSRNSRGPSTNHDDDDQPESVQYYLRLHSHTFPTPLVPRVTAILGQVRVGTMIGGLCNDKDKDAHDDDDACGDEVGGGCTTSAAFLKDLGRRCRDMHRHLLAYHARQKFVAQLLEMDKRSQKRAACWRNRQQPLIDASLANDDTDMTSQMVRRQASQKDDGELEEAMSDNSVNGDEGFDRMFSDDDDDDDRTEATAWTAVAEEVTTDAAASVPYHHVNHIVVDDQKIKFRLSCTFGPSSAAPQPPKLVVRVKWPEHQALPCPRRVSVAYHSARSNQTRVNDTVRAATERERQRKGQLRRRRHRRDSPMDCSVNQEDEHFATSAAMAISSDEEKDYSYDNSARRAGSTVRDATTVGEDPYLAELRKVASEAFTTLPLRSAIDRLVWKMKDLVYEYNENA
jgi:hypothetical protein